ncbi:fungal pheromone mating factor STE2 GPCR-domain-containing protein [Ampelomyces quisqualis]|uniref:Fungal pheromone mating factor STE2 GPCR-domain-containing protein n=1 Tax=Ampelomyces quisqualis TaxID=50730 RepID=A0A6A5QRV3_AMPQU|nr:fungal pheromone mating factor STE2 GPCR-domain-containing protein [Ampelomyces quisqualis]
MDSMELPPDFDAWKQPITMLFPDGSNFTTSVEYFNLMRIYGSRLSIVNGAQIGATLTLLLVLFLLTRSEKRKSSIFIINAACLLFNLVRCILASCYTTSTLWNPYAQLIKDFTYVTKGDLATTVAANTFTLIVTVLIMISLSLQVWVVCITTAPVHRAIIMFATTLMAMVAVGWKAAYVIINTRETLALRPFDPYAHVLLGSYITQAVAIWFYSLIFTYKLGYAIIQRRKLKMPQFGPMQIVFIMGCQTMIIPAIFTLLQFRAEVPEFGAVVSTIVCIFLPLSAIWAGVANETVTATAGPNSQRRLIQGEFYRTAPNSTCASTSSNTMMDRSRQLSVCTCATHAKGVESVATTPSPRKKSVVDYDDDDTPIGRDFGLSRGDASERV